MRLVVDASPLITYGRIDQLHLLRLLAKELIIPDAVAAEVLHPPAADWLRANCLENIKTVIPRPQVTSYDLGRGETAVLSEVLEASGIALLDDKTARRAARELGLPFSGTLGLLAEAKRKGYLSSISPLVHPLLVAGARFSQGVIHRILEEAGEGTAE